jgi:hypothetical protein
MAKKAAKTLNASIERLVARSQDELAMRNLALRPSVRDRAGPQSSGSLEWRGLVRRTWSVPDHQVADRQGGYCQEAEIPP